MDDDNDPAIENVPSPQEPSTSEPSIYGAWDSCNICHRTVLGLRNEKAKLVCDVPNSPNSSYIDYFVYFIPSAYIKEILLPETNKRDGGEDITWGEFLVYIGLWFLMASINSGSDRRSYWENSPISPWKGAPYRFNDYMTLGRFEYITASLTFIDMPN